MAFLSSSNVKVYPTSYRGPSSDDRYNPESRLTSENNVTSMIRSIADYADGSFVMSWSSPNIVFCIHGYVFEANITGYTSGNRWAKIKLGNKNTGGTITAKDWPCRALLSLASGAAVPDLLDSGTAGSESFYGLEITETEPSVVANESYKLQLLANGSVPESSWLRIKASSISDTDGTDTNDITHTFTTHTFTALTNIYANDGDTNKFSVEASSGNTVVGGTLAVTGATTLSSTLGVTGATTFTGTAAFNENTTFAASKTATFNGAIDAKGNTTLNDASGTATILKNGDLFLGGDASSNNGSIGADGSAQFKGSAGVYTDKLTAATSGGSIYVASNLDPSTASISLGYSSIPFNCVCANVFLVPWATGGRDGLLLQQESGATGSQIYSQGTLKLSAANHIHLKASNLQTNVYSDSKFIASDGLEVAAGKSASFGGDVTIASGKKLDLSGGAEVKYKSIYDGTEAEADHCIITSTVDGIYAITFVPSSFSTKPFTTTMMIPHNIPLSTFIASPTFYLSGNQYVFAASATGTTNEIYINFSIATSAGAGLTGKWKIVRLGTF